VKPIYQTIFGNGADGSEPGNCFAACIASVLELPLPEVPNFMIGAPPPSYPWDDETADVWLREFFWRVNAFLRPHGLYLFEMEFEDALPPYVWTMVPPGGYWIAGGPAARGHQHVVVMRDREMVHDPHPSGDGLEKIKCISILGVLDPAMSKVSRCD